MSATTDIQIADDVLCAKERPNKRKNMVRWWLARLRRLRCVNNPTNSQRARINQIGQFLVDEVEGT
jgi:hypothetical protein